MQTIQVAQISGIAGKIIGTIPVQTRGSITIKIVGNMLQVQKETFYGLETEETIIPIEEVKAIETGEGCTWWLFYLGSVPLILGSVPLILGGFSGYFLIGIIFIVLAFVVKQRRIIIYTSKIDLILFYKKTEKIAPFKTALLEFICSKTATAKTANIPKPPQTIPSPPQTPPSSPPRALGKK